MKKIIETLQKHHRAVYAALIVVCIATGSFLAYSTFREGMDMGDSSTFYAFGRAVSKGEVPFEDFIHFRTPGTAFFHGAFVDIFGEHQSSSTLATHVEIQLLFPLLFTIAAIFILRHKKNPLYAIGAWAGIAFLPAIGQLRLGVGLLAIACYLASFEQGKHQQRYLWAAGILAGLSFLFGQEITMIVAVCFAAGELVGVRKSDAQAVWLRLKPLIVGTLIGLLPLAIFVVFFSDISNFLYYTLYYAFVVQPQYMDLPFPAFGYVNLIYYLPFLIYFLCFLVLYANRKLGKVEGLLLSYGVLRLITALGRSDMGHLLFSIHEIFLIAPFILFSAREAIFNKQVLRSFLPYGVAVLVSFALAITIKSAFLVFVPFIILLALHRRGALPKKSTFPALPHWANYNVFLALGGSLIILIYIFMPMYISVVRTAKQGFATYDAQVPRLGGVKFDQITYNEVQTITNIVAPLKPDTIFAFPIQAFYYSLAPHHASRFLTFEPQTTEEEQDLTISDLKASKPEVIIFDPLQAHSLSGSLWKISNYITSNYRVHAQMVQRETLWVMTPKETPARDEKLAFNLNVDESNKERSNGVQNTAMSLDNAIQHSGGKLRFFIDNTKGSTLTISVNNGMQDSTDKVCGIVHIAAGKNTQKRTVCSTDNTTVIRIPKSSKPATIQLQHTGDMPLLWNNPTITD